MDSRAVLGRRVALKNDTYAHENSRSQRRPKQNVTYLVEKIFENGRVLGWELSRAFGDAGCKRSRETQQRVHEEYLGYRIRSNCKDWLVSLYNTLNNIFKNQNIYRVRLVQLAPSWIAQRTAAVCTICNSRVVYTI